MFSVPQGRGRQHRGGLRHALFLDLLELGLGFFRAPGPWAQAPRGT
jgi:hypothetical protein